MYSLLDILIAMCVGGILALTLVGVIATSVGIRKKERRK